MEYQKNETKQLTDELTRLRKLAFTCAAASQRSGGAWVSWQIISHAILWLYLYRVDYYGETRFSQG